MRPSPRRPHAGAPLRFPIRPGRQDAVINNAAIDITVPIAELHAELRPKGLKVTAVVAGSMRTPFLLDRCPDIDPGVLQDPVQVAKAVRFVLLQDEEIVIPEVRVLPMRESCWP